MLGSLFFVLKRIRGITVSKPYRYARKLRILGSPFCDGCVSKPYRYARKLPIRAYIMKRDRKFQNLIGMLGRSTGCK